MKRLTEKQRAVFEFIRSQIIEMNRPPTIREIGDEFGFKSTGSVRDVLRALAKKGFIEQDPGRARGIRIKAGPGPLSGNMVEVPVVGKVTSKESMDNYENVEEALKLDKSMVPEGRIFAVKVEGNSLINAGINDGDYAFVRKQSTCRAGQIIAVLLKDEVALREFSKKGNIIHLQPKDKRHKPIATNTKKLKTMLLGVLIGAYRRY